MNKEKKLKTFLVIFVLLAGLISGYIVYDKIVLGNNTNKHQKELTEEKVNLKKEYYLLNDEKNRKEYVVAREENEYNVVYDINDGNYIGLYDNKIYYNYGKNINYLDLSENVLVEKNWVSSPCAEISARCDDYLFSDTVIVNDKLYFGYSSGGLGYHSLNMNAKNINEATKILVDNDLTEKWIDEKTLKIYYSPEYSNNTRKVPKEYDIKNETTTQLLEPNKYSDAEIIKYYDNKIIYYYYHNDLYNSNLEKIYSCNCTPHYELYVLDVNTKETNFISNISREDYFPIADIKNEKIYYMKDKNSIYEYDINSKTEKKYYDDIKLDKDVVNITAISEQVLKIYYNFGEIEYIINGESKSPEIMNVKMLDNKINTYNIYDLLKIK